MTKYRLIREYNMRRSNDEKQLSISPTYITKVQFVTDREYDTFNVKFMENYVDDDFYSESNEDSYTQYDLRISKVYSAKDDYEYLIDKTKKDERLIDYEDFEKCCEDVLTKIKLVCASASTNNKKISYEDIKLVVEDF